METNLIRINLKHNKATIPQVKGMSLIETIVFHGTLIAMFLGPFAMGMYAMYLINTTSFKTIIGF